MMRSSTGGEQVTSERLRPYEGLVRTTARMFASQVGRELEDLEQELRVKVWQAITKYDPARSSLTEERYVFGALQNKMKDYKRDAAREVKRRQEAGIAFVHIEDMRMGWQENCPINHSSQQEAFDSRYNFMERDEVYGMIEEGKFVVPSGVTGREADVLVLLMMEVSKTEIALRLGIAKSVVYECIAALRVKFADWQPSDSSRVVKLSTVQTVRAEDQLVGSRAA